jgi:hypothetical protein
VKRQGKGSLRERLFTGIHPGLPPKVTRVPFGLESRSREATGLTEAELQVVVAVVAASYVQLGPVTHRQINDVVDCHAGAHLYSLVQSGWLEEVGKIKGCTAKMYAPTARAWRELGLSGWSLLKEVA